MIDKRIADPDTDEIMSVSLKKVCCSALKFGEKQWQILGVGRLRGTPHPFTSKNPWNKWWVLIISSGVSRISMS